MPHYCCQPRHCLAVHLMLDAHHVLTPHFISFHPPTLFVSLSFLPSLGYDVRLIALPHFSNSYHNPNHLDRANHREVISKQQRSPEAFYSFSAGVRSSVLSPLTINYLTGQLTLINSFNKYPVNVALPCFTLPDLRCIYFPRGRCKDTTATSKYRPFQFEFSARHVDNFQHIRLLSHAFRINSHSSVNKQTISSLIELNIATCALQCFHQPLQSAPGDLSFLNIVYGCKMWLTGATVLVTITISFCVTKCSPLHHLNSIFYITFAHEGIVQNP